MPRPQYQESLRHGQAQRVGARHNGGFGDGRVLDQHALQFERADSVIRCLEYVIGAADVGQVAAGIARRNVGGVIHAAAHGFGGFVGVTGVAFHQAGRP